MFGDCQVLSMGGGNVDNSLIYPSSTSIQNPNFNFMTNPFSNIFSPIIPKEEISGMQGKSKLEEMESGSGSDQHLSGNELEAAMELQDLQPQSKKKRYHRHTAVQIQEMESLFKECPHPDDKQRLKLSQDLGLKPRQVKFWFQNRRTQMKAQQDRQENVVLRAENESLKTENYRLQATLRNIVCPNCGGPAMLGEMGYDEQQLRIENARLKDEFERVCCLISQYNGRSDGFLVPHSLELDMSCAYPPRKVVDHQDPMMINPGSAAATFIGEAAVASQFGGGLMILEDEKSLAMEMAVSSMDELVKMCHTGEPLWIRKGQQLELNIEEYARMFSANWNPKPPQFKIEATRDTAVVIMNSITLVDAFLDANKWMELFPCIISRAKTLQVVHSDASSGHASGSIHLMYAELQVVSPLVPTRETHFLRYCQHNADEGSWCIVDFPLDGFQNDAPNSTFPYYKRHPSGCIIQDMPNGYSRVTWVEHAEVEDPPMNQHPVLTSLVSSNVAFGAHRWLSVLQRQCERLASLMARNISDLGVIPSSEARKSLMNLAQRMIRTFCLNMSTCYGQSWTALSDSADDTVRITTRKVTEPGQPNGLILSAVSTTCFSYPQKQVFDFLRDERLRAQLELLSNGNSLHEVAHIANGSNPGNCISLLRINVASNSSQSVELVLQETCSDDSGSMVVYTTIDVDAIQMAMNGQDPSCIPLLPVGFVIVPMSSTNTNTSTNEGELAEEEGCLVSVCLQVVISTIPTAKLSLSSVTAINHHLCNTVEQINQFLRNSTTLDVHDHDDDDFSKPSDPAASTSN